MMSESQPPHLPSTRIGKIFGFHVTPVTPIELSDAAPMIPATRVPCQELFSTSHPLSGPDVLSA